MPSNGDWLPTMSELLLNHWMLFMVADTGSVRISSGLPARVNTGADCDRCDMFTAILHAGAAVRAASPWC